MKPIIAPTDFSTVSINAVNYAADMALTLQTELVLAHISDLSSMISDTPVISTLNYDEEWGIEKLSKLKEKILQRTNNKIAVRIENLQGSVFSELGKLCEREMPFAIVMATHGPSAFERIFFRSVTLYAAKHIKFPVLIVPANTAYKGIKNIGLACDLKNVYEEPLENLRVLVSTFHAKLHVLHVKSQEQDEHFAELMLTRHYLKEFEPALHYIEGNMINESIFSFVMKNAIDLLIIIPKHHEPFEKSEFKEFIMHPEVPLMALQSQLI